MPDDAATLDGLLSSFRLAGSSSTVPSVPAPAPTTAVPTPAPTTPAPAPTTPGVITGGFAVLQQQLLDQFGVTLTPEQGQCLATSNLEANNEAELLAVLLNCGIDVMNLPSG